MHWASCAVTRADAGAVRHGAERAELQAEFSLADAEAAARWLRDADLDDGDACQLRLTLRADGGSRAWINGRAVTLVQLAELAGLLVEIHGQHEQQALLSRSTQTRLLDAYARDPGLLEATRTAALRWRALRTNATPYSPSRCGRRSAVAAPLRNCRRKCSNRRPWPNRRQPPPACPCGFVDRGLRTRPGRLGGSSRCHATPAVARGLNAKPPTAAAGDVDAMLDSASISRRGACPLSGFATTST